MTNELIYQDLFKQAQTIVSGDFRKMKGEKRKNGL